MIVLTSGALLHKGLDRLPSRFLRREDGTITIFGLLIFILMLAIGGVAVDIMRYETQRVQLQYTLDRAVLAAAALNQTLDAEDVVRDYFARSGLERYRLNVTVDQGVNYREVEAYAEMDINTYFMDMFGIRALTSPAAGTAEERIQNIEISMVLDTSGSMRYNSKLTNMQTAAREFVSAVMESNDYDTDEMLVSVSLVPYNGFVNVGSTVASVFTFDDLHTNSTCSRFDTADYATTALDPSTPIQRLAHFDYDYRNYNSYFRRPYCPTDDDNAIFPWSNSVTALHSQINGYVADGWTAIDMGMKWGVALLDPSTRPALTALEGAGTVHEDFLGRPVDFTDDETIKIVILMTDGENTEQWDVSEPFRSGGSGIYYHEDDDMWSIWVPSEDRFWIPTPRYNDNTTFNNPYGTWDDEPYGGFPVSLGTSNESQELSWQWVWSNFTEYAVARNFYYYPAYWTGDWDYYNELRYDGLEMFSGREVGSNGDPFDPRRSENANANLRSICDAARANGILVFTIAFEAPPGGQDVMQYCATSAAHYYDVDGIEISDAFASIANTINQLRLTQ
ncbi:hypothetical protein HKCCE3408_07380 [Rhodobacterales bacterium HKCCE3408]|nr:hypothetical protein [Rhodobacterales bacterium HKCCE3408]